ncbi:hypothetical protein L3X38_031994 [Prunus dulcis]|uniref:Uncharacterized protein n=1 Tax=Prunus dulcis TaxID=3755 RepID=A0AAD4VFG6_PRUDU|nr:hypothetical protein L3X38_031994 [Prunus dulcis]
MLWRVEIRGFGRTMRRFLKIPRERCLGSCSGNQVSRPVAGTIAAEGQNSRHAEANVEAQSSKPVVLEVEAESLKSAVPNVEFGHSKSF